MHFALFSWEIHALRSNFARWPIQAGARIIVGPGRVTGGCVALNRTILVVDDSEVTRAVLTSRLEARGASVVCAGTMADALAVDAAGFTAAIVDVELGADSGVTLADVLADRNPTLRLALFTAQHATHDRRTFKKPDDIDSVIAWALAEV
jgi:CheY-like chemotaxis protein